MHIPVQIDQTIYKTDLTKGSLASNASRYAEISLDTAESQLHNAIDGIPIGDQYWTSNSFSIHGDTSVTTFVDQKQSLLAAGQAGMELVHRLGGYSKWYMGYSYG